MLTNIKNKYRLKRIKISKEGFTLLSKKCLTDLLLGTSAKQTRLHSAPLIVNTNLSTVIKSACFLNRSFKSLHFSGKIKSNGFLKTVTVESFQSVRNHVVNIHID